MLKKLGNLFKKKWVRFSAIGIAAACVIGAAYSGLNAGTSVQTTATVYQPIEESFYEDGMVRAQNRSAVSADVSGKVVSVLAEEGQSVKEGDVLLTIDTSDLLTNLNLLEAQRDGILASWAQADEQVGQQIASLKSQRAGYYTAEQRNSLTTQINMLYASLDPNDRGSVAYSYLQMVQLNEERLRYASWQLGRAEQAGSATADAIENQLNAARVQLATFENQKTAYEVEFAAGGNDPADLNDDDLYSTYNKMIGAARSQVSDLNSQLSRAERQIPESVDSINSQILSLHSDRESIDEQWNNYQRQANAQILSLQAQQSSEKAIRSNMDTQISQLEKSSGTDSSTANYYAAQIRQVDANIEEIERKIENATVRSPMSGVVGSMDIVSGQMLAVGTQITEIVDSDSLEVECMLLTGDAGSVGAGTPVTIVWERKDNDVSFAAKVNRISALAVNSISAVGLNEQRVKVVLEPEFGEAAHPMDGYQVRVKFTLASETALTVPKSAIVKSDKGDAVFVLRDGYARLTTIETGLESGGLIAVNSGLTADDVVISDPTGLDDGVKVKQ